MKCNVLYIRNGCERLPESALVHVRKCKYRGYYAIMKYIACLSIFIQTISMQIIWKMTLCDKTSLKNLMNYILRYLPNRPFYRRRSMDSPSRRIERTIARSFVRHSRFCAKWPIEGDGYQLCRIEDFAALRKTILRKAHRKHRNWNHHFDLSASQFCSSTYLNYPVGDRIGCNKVMAYKSM